MLSVLIVNSLLYVPTSYVSTIICIFNLTQSVNVMIGKQITKLFQFIYVVSCSPYLLIKMSFNHREWPKKSFLKWLRSAKFNIEAVASKKNLIQKKSTKKTSQKKSGAHKKNNNTAKGSTETLLAFLKPLIIFFVALFCLLLILWVAYLDYEVRTKFEGKRWSVPAKVYARPLELYEGLSIDPNDLQGELKRLRYSNLQDGQALVNGSYSITMNTRDSVMFSIMTRGFQYSEESQAAQEIHMMIQRGTIVSLNQALGRLEPQLIGGIYPAHNEDRILIQLEETPPFLIESLVLVEDKDFFNHHGVSPKGILRAAFVNFTSGKIKQGGSTLTQQLIKNFYLSGEVSLIRKANEAIMAILLELHYSKNEILQAYLNEVYLGQVGKRGIHGFGLASQHYFGMELIDLDVHQVALLAAIVNGASYYEPRRNSERALKRRNLVLSMMVANGFISEQQGVFYQQKSLGLSESSLLRYKKYPAFLDLVKRQLKSDYSIEDLQSEGLRIFTGFDPLIQEKAEASVNETVTQLRSKQAENLQAGMLVISPQTSEVLAMVGSADSNSVGFNRVLDAKRSVGSLLKPAIYLTALKSEKYHWASLIDDDLIYIDKRNQVYSGTDINATAEIYTDELDDLWSPRNFDKSIHGNNGKVPLIEAMSRSYNQSTVRLGMQVGISEVVKSINTLGIKQHIAPYPSLFLGAIELSPYEVTQMYQTIASGGFNSPIQAIREVQAASGLLLTRYPFTVQQVIDNDAAYMLHAGLQEVVRSGTARSLLRYLSSSLALAGKTGTSNDQRDSWFVGYGGNMLATVWLGNDDNSETPYTGASGALKVWTHFAINFPLVAGRTHPSENVDWVWVDKNTQLLSDASCDSAVYVALKKSMIPVQVSECGRSKRFINKSINNNEVIETLKQKSKGFFKRFFERR